MKKMLLTSAVVVLSVPVANAAPQIYGKAFLTADYVNGKADYDNGQNVPKDFDTDSVQINSNFSRLGLKGSEAITANTDIIYQLEYGTQIDGDSGDTAFSNRDTYLGLKNETYGEFRVGRNSSVFSYVYNPVVTRAYWDNLGKRTLNDDGGADALNMLDYTRQNSSVLWITPKYEGLGMVLQYAADENSNDKSDTGYGASLMFDKGTGFTAGLAYSKDIEASGSLDILDFGNGENNEGSLNYGGDAIRGAVTIDVDKYISLATPLTLGAVYQQVDYDFAGSDKEKGLIVSGKMALNNFARPTSVYLQYNKTDNLNGIGNNDSDQIVLGGEYKFKDNVIAHAYIGQNTADYTSPLDVTHSVADIKVFALGGGLEYLF